MIVRTWKRFIIVVFCVVMFCSPLNYLIKLVDTNAQLRTECRGHAMNSTDHNIQTFCAEYSTWRICAILGMVITVLLIIFALLKPEKTEETGELRKGQHFIKNSAQERCWTFSCLIIIVFIIGIFSVLVHTNAHVTTVSVTPGLKWAADTFLGMLTVILVLVGSLVSVLITTSACWCSKQLLCNRRRGNDPPLNRGHENGTVGENEHGTELNSIP